MIVLAALTDAQWGMLTTAGVAIAGIVGQVVMSGRHQEHERQLAQVDRLQRRREEVYVEVLAEMRGVVRDMFATNQPDEIWTELDELRARLTIVGSDEMLRLFIEWRRSVDMAASQWARYEIAVRTWESIDAGEPPASMFDPPPRPDENAAENESYGFVLEAESTLASMERQAAQELGSP